MKSFKTDTRKEYRRACCASSGSPRIANVKDASFWQQGGAVCSFRYAIGRGLTYFSGGSSE